LVRWVAAGLCHSDEHLRTGDIPVRYPIVGGHEGAGVVEEVGPGVTRLAPGDHIVCSFLPTCGHCRFCARGMTNLCDLGALLVDNCLPDGTFRLHGDGLDFGQMCLLGTFAVGDGVRAQLRKGARTCRLRWWRWSAVACRPAGAPRSTRATCVPATPW
jgi:S-(hydroxymethyl)glutathione dehydrogenase/alcohol dehydrogenase